MLSQFLFQPFCRQQDAVTLEIPGAGFGSNVGDMIA